jgi:hypothetical protein
VTVRGRIEEYPLGYLIISTTNNNSLASIRIPETGERYRIQMDTLTGTHYLLEENTDQLDELEDGPTPIPPPLTKQEAEEIRMLSEIIVAGPLEPVNLDVMIVYTPLARQWADSYGGGIANVIAQAVAKGQLALDNSNTVLTITLVYSGEVTYTESGSSSTDLDRLQNTSDGYMDSVHTLRNQYYADIVGLFTKVEDAGGVGYLLSTTSGSPAYAFSISRVQQAGWTYTYIHEMGHNMGCHHRKDQATQPGPGLFSYSAGWHWVGNDSGKYCSVMSYEDGGYNTVAYFSNPSILYQGVATGHSADGDNARTLREIKNVIAAYRQQTQTGSLSVTISPQGAIDAGAKWRRTGTSTWRNSGDTESGIPTGQYTVEFSTISGWNTPANQIVQINNGQTTYTSGTYTIISYTLTVNSSGASPVSISSSTGHGGTTNYTKTVTSGTSVNLQAPQYVGSCASRTRFNGWTGSVTSSDQSITFTMDGVKTVTANYVADPETYTLTVNSSGASGVNISSSTGHGGITNYTKTVTCGTSVMLTAPSTASGKPFTEWTGDITSSSQTISFTMNGNKNVTVNFTSPDAPVLHIEPNITPGLCNMISWDAVSMAKDYYAECSSDPCFLVVDYNSGWTTRTSYQFCGLTSCQEYWYRVKSGLSAWSQTSQAEFETDTLTDTIATSDGNVVLNSNIWAPIVDTVGGSSDSIITINNYFNCFLVTTETVLKQIEVYLGISTSVSIEFVVYEGGALFGDQYNRIHSSTLAGSGTGTKFYSSGPVSIPLQAGKHYMIGVVCSGSAKKYYSSGHISPSFGSHVGYGSYDGFPSPNTLTNISGSAFTFYHRYTSAQTTDYTGDIVSTPINLPAGGSWDVVDFNTTTPADTELTVDILPATGSTPITGYENVPGGDDLSVISEPTIRVRANLSTNDPNSTPALHDWSVTYTDPTGIESDWSNIESSIQVIPGDFEPDCDVDWYDFAVLGNQWLQSPGTPSADIAPLPEGDGIVNSLDLAEFAMHWLEGPIL